MFKSGSFASAVLAGARAAGGQELSAGRPLGYLFPLWCPLGAHIARGRSLRRQISATSASARPQRARAN